MMKRLCGLGMPFLCLALLAGLSFAQGLNSGALTGAVLDTDGQPLPGAEVKVTSPALLGGPKTQLTDANGRFRFVLLPGGTYVLEASMPGFRRAQAEGVRLAIGQTITVDLTLRIGTLEQEVTVTGKAPLVDIKDTQTLVTNLDRTVIETVVPNRNKDSTQLIDMAPGTAEMSVMGAANRGSNNWQIDGMNVTWMAYGAEVNYSDLTIIDNVQVSGIGANAEYGNFSGAMMNVTTKSGGNAFEGLGEISFSSMKWTQSNIDAGDPIFSFYPKPPRQMYFDAHVGIGGPILKDKLWFYLAGGQQQRDKEISGFDKRESRQLPSAFFKLSFQPGPRDRIQAFIQWEGWVMYNRGLSPYRPLEATYKDYGPDSPVNLSYNHTFSKDTYLEASAGFWHMNYQQIPRNGTDVSEHHDNQTGLYSGNFSYWCKERTGAVVVSAKVTHHTENFLKGSHDFKFGVEFLAGREDFSFAYSGGYRYEDNIYYGGSFYSYAYSYSMNQRARGKKVSAFVQDSWQVSPRLTVNPGLRFSTVRGTLPNVPQKTFKPTDTLEPRIGLTWDIFGDHSTALKLHFGRYVESIKTNYFAQADEASSDWILYSVLPDGQKLEIFRSVYSNSMTIDPNIRMPSQNQFSLGLERTLGRNTVAGLTLVHRRFRDFIGPVNTAGSWTTVPFSFVDDTGKARTMDVYYKTSPSSSDQYLITNPVAGKYSSVIITPRNTYTGLTLFFEKRFSDKWMLYASYSYGAAKGIHSNTLYENSGTTAQYLDPNQQIFANGNLPYDPTHIFKIFGTIVLPGAFQLSPRISYYTGHAWARTVRLNNVPGAPTIKIEPRGAQRLPAVIDLDFRLEKVVAFSQKMRIGFLVDAYNLINRGVPRDVFSRVDLSYFGKAADVNQGRSFRVAFRFFF